MNEKKKLRNKLQLFGKKISADENITLDTANLPKTNSVTSTHKTEHQNLCKRLSSEIITERSKSPQSSKKIYAELPAKKTRYSRYEANELDNSLHDEHRKLHEERIYETKTFVN